MMKLLLISNEYPPIGGGGSVVIEQCAKEFIKQGHDVTIITAAFKKMPSHEQHLSPSKKNILSIIRVPCLRRKRDTCNIFELITYSCSALIHSIFWIKKHKPDVIVGYFLSPGGGLSYLLGKLFKIPNIIYIGGCDLPGSDNERYKTVYRLLYKPFKHFLTNSTAVVACSEEMKHLTTQLAPNRYINVISNGVDTKRFHPIERKDTTNTLTLLTVGRLIPRKGIDNIIKILPTIISQTSASIHLVIIGDGPEKQRLLQLAKLLKVEKQIYWGDTVDYQDLPTYYQQADIYISASHAEGMSCVVLEAMASGLPVIATKISGNNELIKNGVNGFLYPISDCDQLGKHAITLLNSDTLRYTMRINNLSCIQKYQWENIAKQYLNVFKQLI